METISLKSLVYFRVFNQLGNYELAIYQQRFAFLLLIIIYDNNKLMFWNVCFFDLKMNLFHFITVKVKIDIKEKCSDILKTKTFFCENYNYQIIVWDVKSHKVWDIILHTQIEHSTIIQQS